MTGSSTARDATAQRAPLDLRELTVARAQAALRAGSVSAEELAQAFLARIALVDPHYNAIICANPEALAAARAVDRRRAAGAPLGPLAGIPVVVKDTMDMAGLPTTGGWARLTSRRGGVDLLPALDATVVARLRAAGAIVLGKTNVPVLSHSGSHADDSWAGPTFNAAGRAFLPGGSSAGTATAVAASMAVLGLGEETGGSIQNPAAAQALVGIKPTFGLVSCAGVMPLCGLRDVVGPIARCVHDAALALDVLDGYCADDAHTAAAIGRRPDGGYAAGLASATLAGRRLGLYGPGWRSQDLDPAVVQHYVRVQGELAGQGAVLVADPFRGSGLAQLRRVTPPLVDGDERGLESLPYDLQRYLERLGPGAPLRSFAAFMAAAQGDDPFAPQGVLSYLAGFPEFLACRDAPHRAPEQAAFVALREQYLRIVAAVFERERLDALVFPQMRCELPGAGGGAAVAETTVSEVNIAGLPAITVPGGYFASGAPFGLVFVGPPWSEARLLALAHAYEGATRHRRAPVLRSDNGAVLFADGGAGG